MAHALHHRAHRLRHLEPVHHVQQRLAQRLLPPHAAKRYPPRRVAQPGTDTDAAVADEAALFWWEATMPTVRARAGDAWALRVVRAVAARAQEQQWPTQRKRRQADARSWGGRLELLQGAGRHLDADVTAEQPSKWRQHHRDDRPYDPAMRARRAARNAVLGRAVLRHVLARPGDRRGWDLL